MPISAEHKTVFIHIPKTGGGSIEKALGIYGINNKGSNIHCTKIFYGYREVTHERMEEFKDNCTGEKYKHCCNRGFKKIYKKYMFHPLYNEEHALQHFTINEIKKKKCINSYFKFTIVRNPFERLVSEYEWRKSNNGNKIRGFKEFIYEYVNINYMTDRHLWNQHKFITNKKMKILVDFTGRYENLEEDFKTVAKKLNLDTELPVLHNTSNYNYKDYYDHETVKTVGDIYKTDLELFNYKF